jgi:hypothetical protein
LPHSGLAPLRQAGEGGGEFDLGEEAVVVVGGAVEETDCLDA